MPKVIVIRTTKDIQTCLLTLKRINTRLPSMTRQGMRQWGGILVEELKISAERAGIRASTGTLFDRGIRWQQGKKSDKGYLFMRLYGIYLDSMQPHWVNVSTRRMRLLRWARTATNSKIRTKAAKIDAGTMSKFSIMVYPHPYIRRGYKKAKSRLSRLFKRKMISALR